MNTQKAGEKVRRFSVGDAVEWESQSGGYRKLKRGTVIEVVPARDGVTFYLPNPEHYRGSWGYARNEESYVVSVPSPKGKSSRLYWPRTTHLRHVQESVDAH